MGGKWEHRLTEIDEEARTAVCSKCGPVSIRPHQRAGGKTRWRCKTRKRWPGKRNRNWNTRRHSLRGAGITSKEFQSKPEFIAGICQICLQKPLKGDLVLDHCHNLLQYRGVLCRTCNTGLGFFKDDPNLLRSAIAYLTKT